MAGRAKDLITDDVRKLITHLTGFSMKEDRDNFELCQKFAISNLLHHRYLSVDSHAVRRSIFGMVTKFMIHGHLESSRKLDSLLNKFLDCKLFDKNCQDLQWSLLLLLLKLANNPTNHVGKKKTVSNLKPLDEEIESTSDIDQDSYVSLCDYLRQGQENFDTNFNESSDSDDWEDSSDGENRENKSEEKDESGENEKRLPAGPAEKKYSRRERLAKMSARKFMSEKWLTENVQKQFWHNQQPEVVTSVLPSAKLAETWEKCKGGNPTEIFTLSEYKIIREILWMFHVPTTTRIFQETDGNFTVKPGVCVPSLTKESLQNYLNSMCRYFGIVYSLQKFQQEVLPIISSKSNECKHDFLPHTLEAYASALMDFLRELQHDVIDIEKLVKMQEETFTLYSLNMELGPKLLQLCAVYSVHVDATRDWAHSENWLAAVRLLSVVFTAAVSAVDRECPGVLIKLFLKSFRPYVDIIDLWLSEGRLEDSRNEFLIVRCGEASSGDCPLEVRPYADQLSEGGLQALPLLQMLSHKVLHAGRCMQLLLALDRLADMRSQAVGQGQMYTEFLQSLEQELGRCSGRSMQELSGPVIKEPSEPSLPCDTRTDASSCAEPTDALIVDVATQLEKFQDNFLMQAFKEFIPFKSISRACTVRSLRTDSVDIFGRISKYPLSGLVPLKPVLERTVGALIDRQHAAACRLLKAILMCELQLPTHLALVRSTFLMEAGEVMHRFCLRVFCNADLQTFSACSYALSMHLDECLSLRFPDLSSKFKFSVLVNNNAKMSGTPSLMDEISLQYAVEWPLTLILTPGNMEVYNSVFQFLLKINWALWSLHNMRFPVLQAGVPEASTGARYRRSRLMQLLRFWLLHAVGSVHTYLMGQVLNGLALQLRRDLEAAEDLNSLVRAHAEYVQLVHQQCLQPQSADVIKTGILQLVRLALQLRELWSLGVRHVSDSELRTMAEMYIKCHCFLGSVLQNCVEAGQFPHYELAMAVPSFRGTNVSIWFGEHMKHTLTNVAWQKNGPSGLPSLLPPTFNKYFKKEMWRERRALPSVLKKFLNRYFDSFGKESSTISEGYKQISLHSEKIVGILNYEDQEENKSDACSDVDASFKLTPKVTRLDIFIHEKHVFESQTIFENDDETLKHDKTNIKDNEVIEDCSVPESTGIHSLVNNLRLKLKNKSPLSKHSLEASSEDENDQREKDSCIEQAGSTTIEETKKESKSKNDAFNIASGSEKEITTKSAKQKTKKRAVHHVSKYLNQFDTPSTQNNKGLKLKLNNKNVSGESCVARQMSTTKSTTTKRRKRFILKEAPENINLQLETQGYSECNEKDDDNQGEQEFKTFPTTIPQVLVIQQANRDQEWATSKESLTPQFVSATCMKVSSKGSMEHAKKKSIKNEL